MMDAQNFLQLAATPAAGATEAEWRSAVSRAYYAAFHTARILLSECGFVVPRGEQAHAYLWLRLSNARHPDVQFPGRGLKSLRSDRNWADYDIDRLLPQNVAINLVQAAQKVIGFLRAAASGPIQSQVTEAIKTYERDVLKEMTWVS